MGKEKKDIQFYTKNYKDLFNFLQNNLDNLDSETQNMIKGYLDSYTSVFKGNKSAIDYLRKTNKELADLFNKIDSELGRIFTEMSNINDQTTQLLTNSGKSKEELDKAIIAYKEINKLNEENSTIKDSLIEKNKAIAEKQEFLSKNGFILSKTYKEQLNTEINDLEKSKKILKDKITLNEQSIKNNEKLKKGFSNSDLKNQIENEKKIVELKKEQIKLSGEANKLQEDASESLEEHTKNVGVFTEMAKQAGKAIIAVAKVGFEKWKEIDEKVFSVGRQIGLSSNQLKGYQQNVLNNYDELASKLGMSFEELFKFQESYTKNTGRAIVLTNEQVMSLGTMSKLVGDVATNDMVKNMDDFGASTQTATSYLALNMARARSQGLDAQKASETFAKNVKLAASHNFREGVNGISKMTLLSQKLKFNMDSIANAADKFETVEGAIGTAANLQMLGGSYAAQFGNPLEAMNMAMLDMEGFTNKIVDTFSGKAIFNRETGQVEMSAIDKRLMKESAKQLGISYDEAWNIASQQAKIGDIERQINKTQNFSEEDISWITSNSQYNAETKQHQVTFFENGKQKTVDVKDLTAEQLKEVKAQAISEKAIQGDVQGIHSILKAYAQKEMGDSKSWNEMQKGWQETMEINIADAEDGILNWIKVNPLKFMTDENWWLAKLGLNVGSIALGSLIYNYIGGLFERGVDNFGRWASPSMTKFKGKIKGLGGKLGQSTKSVGKGIVNGAKWIGKNGLKLIKNPYVLGATALATGIGLMSSADGSQVDKSKLGGREVEPNDINKNELESTNVNKTEELTELQKQTVLLSLIANKQGVDVSHINNISSFSDSDVENNREQNISNASSVLSDVTNTTLITSQIGSTKIAEKGLTAIAGKSGIKMAANMGKMAKAANPLGWISLGSGVLKDISGVEEGSGTDKAWSTANSMLDGASMGAMIGSFLGPAGTAIGAGVGTLVGGAIGIIDNYGKDIADFASKTVDSVGGFLFGSDNMTESDKIQQQYEETKIGIVDIKDPQLEQKAQLATCQIHDIVVSMWHHMNGKQSNGLEQDKGLFSGIGDTFNNVSSYISSNIKNQIISPFKFIGGIAKGLFGSEEKENNEMVSKPNKYFNTNTELYNNVRYGNNEIVSKPNTYHSLVNSLYDNVLVKDMYYNNTDILSKPIVGEPTWIKNTVDFKSPNYINDSTPINNKLDLNVSGTIKLTSDKGQNVNLDIDKLLNNSEFVRKLTEVITNRLNKNSNGGRTEKNSVESINNASSVKTRNQ